MVKEAKQRNLEIVSAMGAGNRTGVPSFKIADVYKTHTDGLARKFRKMLRDEGVESLPVAFSEEKPQVIGGNFEEKVIGSTSYSPAMCGCTISAYVINKIIEA